MFENRHCYRILGVLVIALGLGATACDTQDAGTPDSDRAAVHDDSADAPEASDALRTLQPRRTLAGHLRFTGPSVRDPQAAGVFIDRLTNGDEPAAVRAALAEALPRTGGAFAEAAAALIQTDPDATVRATLVETMKRAEIEHAVVVLRHGFSDPDPSVRAAAARVSGMHKDGALLRDELSASLADSDVTTRVWAARSIGVLRIKGAEQALVDSLEHANADLRLQALRAILRIDAEFAAALPQLETLEHDPDARVARVAADLATSR
jgi:hypothetical protein